MRTARTCLGPRFWPALAILFLSPQVSGQVEQKFAQAQMDNAKALTGYSWKSRTEVRRKGETKKVSLVLVRHDLDGRQQRTPLGATAEPQLPRRGVRRRVAEKKKNDFVELVERLSALSSSYRDLSPDKLSRFKAVSGAATPEQTGMVQIQGVDIVQPGDLMTIWLDPTKFKLRKVQIKTSLDKKEADLVSEYRDLNDGPTYPARSVLSYPSEELEVVVENFDFELQRN